MISRIEAEDFLVCEAELLDDSAIPVGMRAMSYVLLDALSRGAAKPK